jgi:pimeloyl-ACP methyl ester carboxylesterase
MGGPFAYLVAMARPDLVSRLIVEDVSPPYRRERALPARCARIRLARGSRDRRQVNAGDQAAWEGSPGSRRPAGHLVHAARPDEFATAVLTWLYG